MSIRSPAGRASADRSRASAEQKWENLFVEALPPEQQREILKALADKAREGDVRVAAFLFDRLYGRPSAARPAPGESDDTERYDLRVLDDTELETLARLLDKCFVGGDAPPEAGHGALGMGPTTLPAGPGSVR